MNSFTYCWIAAISSENLAKEPDENTLHSSFQRKKQVKEPSITTSKQSSPLCSAHEWGSFCPPNKWVLRGRCCIDSPAATFNGCSKTNQLDVINSFWDIDWGSLEGEGDNVTWKALLPFSLPCTSPLSLFFLSSLLSCFCGALTHSLQYWKSPSEWISSSSLLFFFSPFLSSFFKVVLARDGRAFSPLGSLPCRFVACLSIVLPKAVQVQQGFVWVLNTG